MMKRIKKMNQTEFAAEIGVAKSYVTELKQAGRLVFTQDGKVDVDASKLLIAETADPSRSDVKDRHAETRGAPVKGIASIDGAEAPSAGATEIVLPAAGKKSNAKDPAIATHASAKANKEHWLGLQAKLDYETSLGKMVSKEEMQHAVADLVTTFRQELENLPHRIAAELVNKDIDSIRSTLKQEVYTSLQNLQRGCTEKIQGAQETTS